MYICTARLDCMPKKGKGTKEKDPPILVSRNADESPVSRSDSPGSGVNPCQSQQILDNPVNPVKQTLPDSQFFIDRIEINFFFVFKFVDRGGLGFSGLNLEQIFDNSLSERIVVGMRREHLDEKLSDNINPILCLLNYPKS